ncbi:MAG: GspH/FimT family pseudopilin [Desulfobacterales bacterium]|nr:GspH/FimT family pseudopilin [Desulfobacterales bacterium]
MKHQIADSLLACRLKRRRRDGFTLFELLIVLLIVSIFTMLGWPAINAFMGDYRLGTAAEEIVNALEFAQLTAVTGQQTQVTISATTKKIDVKQFKPNVNLLGGAGSYTAAEVENGSYAYLGNPMNKGIDYTITFPNESRFSGVDINASGFDTPVTFDSTGTPSIGGTVTLTFGGRQKVVTLNALTGRVSVSG